MLNNDILESHDANEQSTSRKRSNDDLGNDNNLAKKRKKDPKILDGTYFEGVFTGSESNNITAICKLCGALKKGSCLGMGNFLKHINDYHAEKSAEVYSYIKNLTTKDDNRPVLSQPKLCLTISQDKVFRICSL